MFNFLASFIIFYLISLSNCIDIIGNFHYCHHDENSPILNNHKCINNENNFNDLKLNITSEYSILLEDEFDIEFTASKCKVYLLMYSTYKDFWGGLEHKYPPVQSLITLSALECRIMTQSKICYGNQMKQIGSENGYQYIGIPIRKYSTWITLEFPIYNCFIINEKFQSNNMEKPILFDHQTSCLVKNLECIINDYTYVWNFVPKLCKFKQVGIADMYIYQYQDKLIAISHSSTLYFELFNKIVKCDHEIYQTDLKFYISKVIHNTTFNSIDMNINIHNHLLLADMNYNSHKNNQDINLIFNILVREECNLYNNIINLMTISNTYSFRLQM